MRMRNLYKLAISKQHDLSLRYAAAREMQEQRRKLGPSVEVCPEDAKVLEKTRSRRSRREWQCNEDCQEQSNPNSAHERT